MNIPHVKDFDPNAPTAPKTWGTYVPGRNPTWKTHSGRGSALNAVGGYQASYSGAALFTMDPTGRWQRVALRPARSESPATCQSCGSPPAQHSWDGLKWVWKRERGKIAAPPEIVYICSACRSFNK